jgi:hypothetical protein
MLVNVNREYKERRRPEDGHDRGEWRELKWSGNLDCDIEKILVENLGAKRLTRPIKKTQAY